MTNNAHRKTPFLLWPFKFTWIVVTSILELTGRLVGLILSLVLLIVGTLLSATIIGAILGIPLIILGLALLVRALF